MVNRNLDCEIYFACQPIYLWDCNHHRHHEYFLFLYIVHSIHIVMDLLCAQYCKNKIQSQGTPTIIKEKLMPTQIIGIRWNKHNTKSIRAFSGIAEVLVLPLLVKESFTEVESSTLVLKGWKGFRKKKDGKKRERRWKVFCTCTILSLALWLEIFLQLIWNYIVSDALTVTLQTSLDFIASSSTFCKVCILLKFTKLSSSMVPAIEWTDSNSLLINEY